MHNYKILTGLTVFLVFFVAIAQADEITRFVIEQNDDAEESVTGPVRGNVQRTGSELDLGNKNGIEQWVGLRFQEITIPQGSTINSATVQFSASDDDLGSLVIPVVGDLSVAAESFRDVTPLTTRSQTTASVTWDIPAWSVGDRGQNTTSPNLAAIVQEITNQGAWNSGGPIVFLFKNSPGDTSERVASSFDGNPALAPTLVIDYTPPAGVLVVNGTGLADTINVFTVTGGVNKVVNGVTEFVPDVSSVEINGLNGSDQILTNFPGVVIFGGGGSDSITVNGPSGSTIYGEGGDDIILGSGGGDLIDGGSGNDNIDGRSGADVIDGGSMSLNPGLNTLRGGPGRDFLIGGSNNDIMFGDAGNDVLLGKAGNDQMDGGAGADVMEGAQGFDIMVGGDGVDLIRGGSGDDVISGGDGRDFITGGEGIDVIGGGNGNDVISGGGSADVIFGASGNDDISAGSGPDVINGGSGNDTINGDYGADIVNGNFGDDVLTGGPGIDELHGGPGFDTATDTGEAGETGIEN